MVMEKNHRVVMLPTENKSRIGKRLKFPTPLTEVGELAYLDTVYQSIGDIDWDYQHLYLISNDDDIKEGDWVYVYVPVGQEPYIGTIHQVKGYNSEENTLIFDKHTVGKAYCRKVIASTDLLYWKENPKANGKVAETVEELKSQLNLPQFSEDFIKAYVKANGISDVMVEYSPICCNKYTSCNSNCSIEGWKLKLTDNNEVIISMVRKKVYDEKDMYKAFMGGYLSEGGQRDEFDKWIEVKL